MWYVKTKITYKFLELCKKWCFESQIINIKFFEGGIFLIFSHHLKYHTFIKNGLILVRLPSESLSEKLQDKIDNITLNDNRFPNSFLQCILNWLHSWMKIKQIINSNGWNENILKISPRRKIKASFCTFRKFYSWILSILISSKKSSYFSLHSW